MDVHEEEAIRLIFSTSIGMLSFRFGLEQWNLLIHHEHINAARVVANYRNRFDIVCLCLLLLLLAAAFRGLPWLLLTATSTTTDFGRDAKRDHLHWDADPHPRLQLRYCNLVCVLL